MARLSAEVVYATLAGEDVARVSLPEGATLRDAVLASGILARHPEVETRALVLGIFGRIRPATARVAQGDRIEIYRHLQVDPKEARRQRYRRDGIKRAPR